MVAKNHCLMMLRNKGNHHTEINDDMLSSPEETGDLQALKDKDKLIDLIPVALQQLNKEQQVCVTLFYLEKKTYQQIAEESGFNLMQVKSHIQNGKRNLRIHIERLQKHEG